VIVRLICTILKLPCIAMAAAITGCHGVSMKSSQRFLIAVVLGGAIGTGALHAQTISDSSTKLAAAFERDRAGNPAQAILAAAWLLASGTLTNVEQADALDLEGICYLELDQMDKAVHALEKAQTLLGPGDTKEQAAVLDNLGRVYASRGNYEVAAHLYERSFRLFESTGHHGGMMRVANNRAQIALSENKNGQARKYLERSDREAKLATDLDKDDLAALVSMHGWLALNEGDTYGGVKAYSTALRLWKEYHGEQHPLTAWGMLLLGQAQSLNGQRKQAAQTMEKGLALTKATLGDHSLRYLAAETAYAKVLDQMGKSVEAAQLRQDAQTKQAAFGASNCRDCTISVIALR
jgi:tetratricopeptide (TPR) repeat protein